MVTTDNRPGQQVRHAGPGAAQDRNAIAVVDRGIQTLKKDLATRVARKGGNADKDLTDRRAKAVEDAGAFRAPTNAARSFNPQYGDVQLGAVDSMTVRSTEGRKTLLKLALPALQNSGNAAGRLTRRRPAAVRQLDDFLAPPRPRTLD